MRTVNKHTIAYLVVWATIIIVPFLLTLRTIINGDFAFWFDPARDFLQALSYQEKLGLIGPPSGIPGIFYGPYWSWILAFLLSFSKDPRFVAFILLLPYAFIFPILLITFFKKIWGNLAVTAMLFVYVVSFSKFYLLLWNLYPAPLLLLCIYILISHTKRLPINGKSSLLVLLIGMLIGLLCNFHLSFGMGVAFGTFLYLVLESWRDNKNRVKVALRNFIFYFCGVAITYVPTLLFELRHDFLQSKAFLYTFINGFLYNSAVVGQTGYSASEISLGFLKFPSQMFALHPIVSYCVWFLIFVFILYFQRQEKREENRKIISYSAYLLLSLVFLYHSTKNPVWEYHFLGLEVIFLMMFGVIVSKYKKIAMIICLWGVYMLGGRVYDAVKPNSTDPLTLQTLRTKEYITNIIFKDKVSGPLSFRAYSPAIYTYDYDYLFKTLGTKYPSVQVVEDADTVYLIIPETSKVVAVDFLNYKTPNEKYETKGEWSIPDKTKIIKRQKKTSQE